MDPPRDASGGPRRTSGQPQWGRERGKGGGRKGKRETDKAIGRHKMERNVGALDKVRRRGRKDIGGTNCARESTIFTI